jgi:hypothetical protein
VTLNGELVRYPIAADTTHGWVEAFKPGNTDRFPAINPETGEPIIERHFGKVRIIERKM